MSQSMLEALSGSRIKAAILKWLYADAKTGETMSERELSKAIHTAPGSVHPILQQLVAAQFVVREETRHGPQYRAPHEDPRLAGLFQMLRYESETVGLLKKALRRFKAIEYACIFGSFANGTTHRASDVDVLVIEKQGLDHTELEIATSKVASAIGREVNVEFYLAEDFLRKIGDRDPFALDVLAKNRIGLKGVEPWQS